MTTEEKDRLTMCQTVLRYLAGPGAALAAIPLIDTKRDTLAGVVTTLVRLSGEQGQTTAGVTDSREELKAAVVMGADALRLTVRTLTTDPQLRGQLKETVKRMLRGEDQAYVDYLTLIVTEIGKLGAQQLAAIGYEAAVLTPVAAAVQQLTTTTGATRAIAVTTAAATQGLDQYFKEATRVLDAEDGLDALVHAQKGNPNRVELVTKYDEARVILSTTGQRRRPALKGTARYGVPVLAADRATLPGADLVLGNKSGKGVTLRYYVAETPDALPLAGQGLVVKRNAEVHLGPDTISKLGDAGGRYLLVMQQEMAADGAFWVRG